MFLCVAQLLLTCVPKQQSDITLTQKKKMLMSRMRLILNVLQTNEISHALKIGSGTSIILVLNQKLL